MLIICIFILNLLELGLYCHFDIVHLSIVNFVFSVIHLNFERFLLVFKLVVAVFNSYFN